MLDKAEQLKKKIEALDRKEFALLKKIEKYEKANKIKFFKPYEKQVAIFDTLRDESKKTIVVQGSNRSGKTTFLVVSLASLLLGEQPWDGNKTRFNGPITARFIGEDWTHHIGEVLIPKLREWIPPGAVASTKKNNQGIDYHWVFKNGSSLEIMTYEQKTDLMEGWSGHVVAADEPMPRDKYVALKRGLVDFNGVFLMGFTPLKEPWIYDEIVTKNDPSIAVFQLDIRDNPYISEEAIQEFESSLTDDEKASRIHGKWLHLTGLVYKDFNRQVHVIPAFDVPHKWTVRVAIDTHPRTEQALVFMATDERDIRYVCKDIFKHGSPEDVADWIVDYHQKVHKIHEVIIEPGSKGDQNRGDTTFTVIQRGLNKSGIVLKEASKDLETGIRTVQDSLKSRNSLPSLFVFSDCDRTIFEFTHYIWDDWRGRTENKTSKNKPRDKDDHMMENIYRLLLLPPIFIDPRKFILPRMPELGVA